MDEKDVERFKKLPVRQKETWQGGFVRSPLCHDESSNVPVRILIPAWISLRTNQHSPSEPLPSNEAGVAQLEKVLLSFAADTAGYRPGKLEVNDSGAAEALAAALADGGTIVEYHQRLSALINAEETMANLITPKQVAPSLLEAKGTTIERVRAFAEAARLCYEARPWVNIADIDLVEIESPRIAHEFRFASVQGGALKQYGLIFFASRDEFWRMMGPPGTWEDGDKGDEWWYLDFLHFTRIPIVDLDLWIEHRLPVAAPTAYPVAGCLRRGRGLRKRPGPKALTWMEGLLRAIAATTEEELDSGRWQKCVETFDGTIEYRLSLTFLIDPPDRRTLAKYDMIDSRVTEALLADASRFAQESKFETVEQQNEALDRELAGKMERPRYAPRSPMEAAQAVCYEAADALGRRRVQLAREALRICPDCADAYVLLAEQTGDPQRALELYAAGVEAGKRAQGSEPFENEAGHFWGVIETRGFMRAMAGLAKSHSALGNTEKAIEVYREILGLNPNDNQGIRKSLLPMLVEAGLDAEAEALVGKYDDDGSATWAYTKALLAFRKSGDTELSRGLLDVAIATNEFVVDYLVDDRPIPPEPDTYTYGDEDEAIVCGAACRGIWSQTDGAIDWLRENVGYTDEEESEDE